MRFISVRQWVLAVLSGLLQVLPFPIAGPVPVWRTAIVWIALLPLLKAITSIDTRGRETGILQGAALAYVSGTVWYLGNCYWIFWTMHTYGGIAKPAAAGILAAFCLYFGMYHATFGALVAAFRRVEIRTKRLGVQGALLLSPFAWVAVELMRERIIQGMPWDPLSVTQVDNPLLVRLAPITGGYGISFVIVLINALWLMRFSLKERRYTRPAITAAGVAVIVLYVLFIHHLQLPREQKTLATATLVQENLEVGAAAASAGPQLTKTQMLQVFSQLSLFPGGRRCYGIPELAATKCNDSGSTQRDATRYFLPTNLIVWPESPAPFEESDPQFRDAMSRLAREANAPIIVGNMGVDQNRSVGRGYDLFNSAEFIQPDGTFAGRYDKMHLVPFGEYVPYKWFFFYAGSLLEDVGTFDPGVHRKVFSSGGETYGTFICYESIFGDEVGELPKLGAGVLVNISNDGWYADTGAAWQHLNMVRMRAIENHRWILRSTNTGVTSVVDPYGRVVLAAPRHIRTSLRVGFNYEHDITFYSAYGDWFPYLCAAVTSVGLGLALMRRAGPTATRAISQ